MVCEAPARRDDATTFWRLTLPWPKDVVAPAPPAPLGRDVATAAPARRPAILNYRGCLYPVCLYFLAVCKSLRRTFLYAFRLILAPWGGSGAGDWLRHAVRRCLSPVLSRTAGTGTFAAKSMPLRSQSPSPGPWLIAVALSGSENDCHKLWAHPLYPVWENTRHCLAAGAVLLGVAGLRRRQG